MTAPLPICQALSQPPPESNTGEVAILHEGSPTPKHVLGCLHRRAPSVEMPEGWAMGTNHEGRRCIRAVGRHTQAHGTHTLLERPQRSIYTEASGVTVHCLSVVVREGCSPSDVKRRQGDPNERVTRSGTDAPNKQLWAMPVIARGISSTMTSSTGLPGWTNIGYEHGQR